MSSEFVLDTKLLEILRPLDTPSLFKQSLQIRIQQLLSGSGPTAWATRARATETAPAVLFYGNGGTSAPARNEPTATRRAIPVVCTFASDEHSARADAATGFQGFSVGLDDVVDGLRISVRPGNVRRRGD